MRGINLCSSGASALGEGPKDQRDCSLITIGQ